MRRASNLLGKQMLLARRLCEAGCGFVTVSDCGWDMHANEQQPAATWPACTALARQVDHAVAAFIEDVEGARPERQDPARRHRRNGPHAAPQQQRRPRPLGQPDTPLLSPAAACAWARSSANPTPSAPARRPTRYRPGNLFATVMHTLFDVGQLRLRTDINRDIKGGDGKSDGNWGVVLTCHAIAACLRSIVMKGNRWGRSLAMSGIVLVLSLVAGELLCSPNICPLRKRRRLNGPHTFKGHSKKRALTPRI